MIYLDGNATASLRPAVSRAIAELLENGEFPGNASSIHQAGRRAKARIRAARRSLAELCGLQHEKEARIVFTSGGTEACNAMVLGFLGAPELAGEYSIVCSSIEHQAILEAVQQYQRFGISCKYIDPNEDGRVCVDTMLLAVEPTTEMLLLMAANNVTGAMQPVEELASKARAAGYRGLICCDASQALGKSSFNAKQLFDAGVDAISLSGHKTGAPSGVGALLLRTGGEFCRQFTPTFIGGPQEERFRAGTENLIGIVGFGAACEEINARGVEQRRVQTELRDALWCELKQLFPQAVRLTPHGDGALCNTLAVSFPGVRGDDLVVALDLAGVAISTGSACSSGRQEISHVFRAMGLSDEVARGAIRVSLDWSANEETILDALGRFKTVVPQVYNSSNQSRRFATMEGN